MEVVVVPDAEMHIRTIDGWWRENRVASPALFAANETTWARIPPISCCPQVCVWPAAQDSTLQP